MHKIALTLPLLACSLFAQGYSSNLEGLVGSAAGAPLAGQDLFYVPAVAGSLDWNVFTYAGNPFNVPANPNGGAQFMAGRSQAGNAFARAQRPVTLPTNALLYVQFDVLCNYVGTATPTNNIGSFSLQPSNTNISTTLLARWPAGATNPPAGWNADFTTGATPPRHANHQPRSELPEPARQRLAHLGLRDRHRRRPGP